MKFLRSWFEKTQEARSAERHRSRKSRPSIESMEARVVLYSATGNAWMNPAVVTISFMPDGMNLGGNVSNLQSTFNSSPALKGWQNVILQAAQAWAQQTNLNFTVVSDNGAASGAGVDQEGDPEFGDIRIGGYNFGNSNLAYTYLPPSVNNYSIAGDITFNTGMTFSQTQTYDLFTVACHEFGHSLGLADTSAGSNAIMYPSYVGKKTALATDDIQGIQSIYSSGAARSPDVFNATNTSFATAANINNYINQTGLTALVPDLNIATAGQAEYFAVNVPAGTTGTMKVQVQTAGLSLMAPKLTVYAANQTVGTTVNGAGQYGTTVSLSISATANAQYFIKVRGADNTAMGTGRYSLGLSFNGTTPPSEASPIIAYANGSVLQSGGGQITQSANVQGQNANSQSQNSQAQILTTTASLFTTTSTSVTLASSYGVGVLDYSSSTTSTQTSTTSQTNTTQVTTTNS